MIRINVFVEGQTEETFVRDVLAPYFLVQQIYLIPILAQTSSSQKGGITSYGKVKHQITRLCRQDPGAFVTTLIDYYGLPTDFPDYNEQQNNAASERVVKLEQAFADDIGQSNFIPHLLLHEFEALLFCQPEKFADWLDNSAPIAALQAIKSEFDTPEDINNSPQTAPSKRILAIIPHYHKTLHGPLIAGDIGLDTIRSQCPHFNQWLETLTGLIECIKFAPKK
ncbi:DUF4276 family protein [Xenorhabdus bovienii]|uniref:DUF4276 family protein n=1 Tax=Xenorhabdus bovienii TaxID=40576 RepID=UPI00237CE3A2|nr:DUF4276 family protein [Xenorhabdus bovienii]MDE1484662.1 DUF4276 family protein [Xenorhabdus bovienii]MDE9442986.1 DUF4276 family protein [Xenorhabdus bovienii]MDE9536792.1 DUF4276 family protein [Xenorhabdus bovienii]MDE9541106.1 DUF4276 family protein [Xenorhabdus bovienii]MDE9589798.1 DUF4276 family protein [Xenorhabdus bovienii]